MDKKLLIFLLITLCIVIGATAAFSDTVRSFLWPTVSSTGTPPAPTNSAQAHNLEYPLFRGFIQFTGNQHPENATNPYLAGASMDFYWSELEPAKGDYRWDIIEQTIKPWTDKGKQVIIRVTTSGNCYPNQNQLSCQRTPPWVFAEGVRKLTDPEGSVHPAYWDNAFLAEYKTFIQAFAQRYDGDPRVIAVNVGDGNDGELRVDRTSGWTTNVQNAWEGIGYTAQVWHNTLLQIIGTYVNSFTKTPLAMQTGQPFLKHKSEEEDTFLTEVHSLYPMLWFQDDALRVGETPHSNIWSQVTHIEEPGKPLTQSGDTLNEDIQQALQMGANYIYIFAADLTPATSSVLSKYIH